ncbi:TAXI family TRAP transporter solute-binding subunit [Azospirillum canadense]|uniref:TAXI family TRAP transporter solute-binding subunit n=1 Tax=Azospirillum canadense TaxID=403962 RepID=UPI002227A1A7|nr:TAXI family TRAP transporter solute-binding subunit [Azospirillum canadense]MCW2243804.1 TRAP transporter TAXI family solute receptor [Azospirillum canadense]
MRGLVRFWWGSLALMAFVALVLLASAGVTAASAHAPAPAEPQVLRLATGGVGGTYHPIGALIADALTVLGGSAPGGGGGASRIRTSDLLIVSQTSNGSVANVEAMQRGQVEMALAQSNIAEWAYRGTGRFQGAAPAASLRAVATLYRESLHLVARPAAGIRSVADLGGQRVSLDEPGSGTLGDVRELLTAYGLSERDFKPEFVKPDFALARMRDGMLDAFFIVAGAPMAILQEAGQDIDQKGGPKAGRQPIALVPIDGPEVDGLLGRLPFYSRMVIPAGTYPGVPDTPTIAVGAQLLVRADLDDALVYRLTRALWSDRTLGILAKGHPKGAQIRPERALDGISIPLHPGAERFYREQGLIR